jgi:hypothetical protein
MKRFRGYLRCDEDGKYTNKNNAGDDIAQIHRHRHGIAAGFAKRRRKDLNHPKGPSDRGHLAQFVLGSFVQIYPLGLQFLSSERTNVQPRYQKAQPPSETLGRRRRMPMQFPADHAVHVEVGFFNGFLGHHVPCRFPNFVLCSARYDRRWGVRLFLFIARKIVG